MREYHVQFCEGLELKYSGLLTDRRISTLTGQVVDLTSQVTFFRQVAQQSMVPKEASNQNQGGLSYAS